MTTKIFTPAAKNHEVAGTIAIPNWPPNIHSPEDWEILIQAMLDRGKYAVDTAASASSALSAIVADLSAIVADGSNIKLTPEGGLAIKMVNRTVAASRLGNVVCPYTTWVVTPGTTTLSHMVNVVGATAANTHAGRLYLVITVPSGDAIVSAYSDEARQTKVAEGTLVGNAGGTVSLAEVGGSGLSFDIDIGADAVQDLTGPYATLGVATGVTLTDTSAINQTGVMYSNGVADGGEVWVVVAGKCYVSMKANTAITCGSALITSASSGGYVDELFAADATKAQRLVGWALERKVTAGAVGTIFCQLQLRGTWGV